MLVKEKSGIVLVLTAAVCLLGGCAGKELLTEPVAAPEKPVEQVNRLEKEINNERDKQLNVWQVKKRLKRMLCELRSGKWYIWKHIALLLAITPLAAFFTSNYAIFKCKPAISRKPAHFIPVFLALFLPQMTLATWALVKAILLLF